MMFKKRFLVTIIILVSYILASCAPSKSRVYTVGDTCYLYSNDYEKIGEIKLESADYSINEAIDTGSLELTYVIYPYNEISLNSQEIFIICDAKKYFTNYQKNFDKNDFDIFSFIVDDEIRYTFYFDIPYSPYFEKMDNMADGYIGWVLECYIEEARFAVYTGIL